MTDSLNLHHVLVINQPKGIRGRQASGYKACANTTVTIDSKKIKQVVASTDLGREQNEGQSPRPHLIEVVAAGDEYARPMPHHMRRGY